MTRFNDSVEELTTSTQLHNEVDVPESSQEAKLPSSGKLGKYPTHKDPLPKPHILKGLVQLNDVGMVHHFHDGNLLS